jgi:orotate phosphoribosyltransferase
MNLEDLKRFGCYQEGHFLLSSGLHSSVYLQCAKLLQTNEGKSKVIEALYHNDAVLQFEDVDVVIGGAYGGIRIASIIAWWIGNTFPESHNPRGIWCERVPEIEYSISSESDISIHASTGEEIYKSQSKPKIKSGKFQLRRGFEIKKGEEVLIAEDVTTTGKSIGEVVELVKGHGGEIVGAISIIDRRDLSKGDLKCNQRDILICDNEREGLILQPFISLIQLDIPTWTKEECPLCKKICENCKFKGNCTLEGGGKAMKNCGWQPKYPLQKLGSKC